MIEITGEGCANEMKFCRKFDRINEQKVRQWRQIGYTLQRFVLWNWTIKTIFDKKGLFGGLQRGEMCLKISGKHQFFPRFWEKVWEIYSKSSEKLVQIRVKGVQLMPIQGNTLQIWSIIGNKLLLIRKVSLKVDLSKLSIEWRVHICLCGID